MPENPDIPAVLAFAGLDPSGGAGLQADIEAIASQGCHPCPVITIATVQDTVDVRALIAIDTAAIIEQARCILEDIPVAAIKIGLTGSTGAIEAIHGILVDYPEIPVVLDPVLAAGSGSPLANDDMREALLTLLVPQTTVLTPNVPEAGQLAPEADDEAAAAMALLERGAEYVLVTGTHADTPDVENRLYSNNRLLERFTWPRLPDAYHGSGCTLASAIAGLLAQGNEPVSAIHQAQEYTWQSLQQGYRIGMGQKIPNRLFWARAEQDDETP